MTRHGKGLTEISEFMSRMRALHYDTQPLRLRAATEERKHRMVDSRALPRNLHDRTLVTGRLAIEVVLASAPFTKFERSNTAISRA